MVIVCCLKSLLPFFNISVCNVAGSAQGHQVFDGVSELASTHPTRFDMVYVNGSTSTHLAGYEVSCGVTKCFQVDLCVVLHFNAL